MKDYAAIIAQCVRRCQREGFSESDFCTLVHVDRDGLPYLMKAFEQETDTQVARDIIEAIWQHRDPSVISFLGQALNDSRPIVWKEALDGLVTLASPQALAELRKAKARSFSEQGEAEEFKQWLDEAISQVEEAGV